MNARSEPPTADRLVELLLETDALRFGEFELANGGTSDYYVDMYHLTTTPGALGRVARAFADRLDGETPAGVALGAVPLVTATALEAGRPYVIARKAVKDHGTANRIEGGLTAGDRVAVIEDVTTTGRSALSAVEALRDAGAVVDRVLVVVDRESGGSDLLADAGVELEALVTATDLLDAADETPA